jgi:hypothetical protein
MAYLTSAIDRGILSVNEARSREGLNPIPGGDVHFFPLNMTTLEAMAKSGEPVQLPQLVQVLAALSKGLITAPAAAVLIQAAFPQLSADQVNAVVAGTLPTIDATPAPAGALRPPPPAAAAAIQSAAGLEVLRAAQAAEARD